MGAPKLRHRGEEQMLFSLFPEKRKGFFLDLRSRLRPFAPVFHFPGCTLQRLTSVTIVSPSCFP
jgi:hypothetical protein